MKGILATRHSTQKGRNAFIRPFLQLSPGIFYRCHHLFFIYIYKIQKFSLGSSEYPHSVYTVVHYGMRYVHNTAWIEILVWHPEDLIWIVFISLDFSQAKSNMVFKEGDAKHDCPPYQQAQTLQEEALQKAQRSSISMKHFRHLQKQNHNFNLYKGIVFNKTVLDYISFSR